MALVRAAEQRVGEFDMQELAKQKYTSVWSIALGKQKGRSSPDPPGPLKGFESDDIAPLKRDIKNMNENTYLFIKSFFPHFLVFLESFNIF